MSCKCCSIGHLEEKKSPQTLEIGEALIIAMLEKHVYVKLKDSRSLLLSLAYIFCTLAFLTLKN